jgi:hypothetical protein
LNPTDFPNLASDRPVSRRALLAFWLTLIVLYALLWSPWWYPLSDSALYLNMARTLARGQGWTAARQLHRDVRPLTPLILAAIMNLGGGIGAMHSVMIALMLGSHAMAFVTLRRWFNERVALMAVAATAASWWVYANSFSIMTEPLFLLCFWVAMCALSRIDGQPPGPATLLVVLATLLLAWAWEVRIAAAFSAAAAAAGLWMTGEGRSRRMRAVWVTILTLVFALLAYQYRRESAPPPRAAGDAYQVNVLVGVRHPLVDLPVSAGRWVIEVLAAPFGATIESKSKALRIGAATTSLAFFALACAGWLWLLRRRRWYAAALAAVNFIPYVVLWGTRIKPRYMTPIAPILFVQLWAGTAMCLSRKRPATSLPRYSGAGPGWGWGFGTALLAMLLVINVALYAIELKLRIGKSATDFYDAARSGAFAELIDIGGYLQKHSPGDAAIWVNWPPPSSRPPDANFAPDKRIVQFLTDRDVRFIPAGGIIHDPSDQAALAAYFVQVTGDWAIVYYDGLGWPAYHLPRIARRESGPSWWQLFHRDPQTRRFESVPCPIDRAYVRDIPGWNGTH